MATHCFSLALLLVCVWVVSSHGQTDEMAPPEDKILFTHDCGLFPHYLPFTTRDGCEGELAVLSCAGRCASRAIPNVRSTRSDASIDRFNGCSCCTVADRLMGYYPVNVTCPPNNVTRTVEQFGVTATACGCGKCN